MNRRGLRNAVVAFVGIVAAGFTAATIRLPSSPGPGASEKEGAAGLSPTLQDAGGEVLSPPPDWLAPLLVALTVVFGVAYFLLNFRHAVAVSAVIGLVAVLAVLSIALTADVRPAPPTPTVQSENPAPENESMRFPIARSGTEDQGTVTLPPVVLMPLLFFAALVTASILLKWKSSPGFPDIFESGDVDESRSESIGAVAGRAADQIESTDVAVDNEVYRAWHEMTDLLDIPSPETSTPGEFAAAAVAAGIQEDHVGELTRLFEEVRYGDMDPEPREVLAVDILRRIEATYGDDGEDEGDRTGAGTAGGGSDR